MISFSKNSVSLSQIYQYRFEPEYRDQFATLYWYTILVLVSVSVLFVAWIGGTQFTGILTDLDIKPHVTKEAPALPLNKGELESYVTFYKEKQARFDSFQTVQLVIPSDPSI